MSHGARAFLLEGRLQSRRYRSPIPLPIRTLAAAKDAQSFVSSGSWLYVATVHRGPANSEELVARISISSSDVPSVVLHSDPEKTLTLARATL